MNADLGELLHQLAALAGDAEPLRVVIECGGLRVVVRIEAVVVTPPSQMSIPPLQLPAVSPVLLSERERILLKAACSGPLNARAAFDALAAAGKMRRWGKIPQSVRNLLSRMAHRRGLFHPPDDDHPHQYRITTLGKQSVESR